MHSLELDARVFLAALSQSLLGELRVGFADIEHHLDPDPRPYNQLSLESLSHLAQVLTRSLYDLIIVDGIEHLDEDRLRGGGPLGERARQIESIFTRVPTQNLALVFTWQANRSTLYSNLSRSIPEALSHRASLILQVEDRGGLVRIAKNRFGESEGFVEFGPRFFEPPEEILEPEFDRSLIKTRFEREDVI